MPNSEAYTDAPRGYSKAQDPRDWTPSPEELQVPFRIIALTGPKGSGKTFAADYCNHVIGDRGPLWRNSCMMPMADGVKQVASIMFGYDLTKLDEQEFKETIRDQFPFHEPRWDLMDIANWMRHRYGGYVHVMRWVYAVRKYAKRGTHVDTTIIMPDLRFPEEIDLLRANNALIIYVDNPEKEAKLLASQAACDAMAKNASESHYALLKEAAGEVITNNIDDTFLESVHNVLKQHNFIK